MAKRQASAADSPFGEASRVELLERHFTEFGPVTPQNAWAFVYEELLWFDNSNGLVHLYESDKVRPGRSTWYERSIAFTNRLCELYGVDRPGLKRRLDRLFLACVERLVAASPRSGPSQGLVGAVADVGAQLGLPLSAVRAAKSLDSEATDYVPYAELTAEVTELLTAQARLDAPDAEALARHIVKRAQYHLTFGSNRQNVLGEGFEDVLRLLAVRVAGVPPERIRVRTKADQLPGFQRALDAERRIEKPDMAIVDAKRTLHLATVKWSLRHDRQKQLTDELDCYVQLLSQRGFPEYVLVTNEYDPGRLKNSARLASRGKVVDRIYHMNLDLLVHVLSDFEPSVAEVSRLIEQDRLRSLERFLVDLHDAFGQRGGSASKSH